MINFLKFTKLYVLISVIVLSIGAYSIATQGMQLAIDFTGGSIIEYSLSKEVDKATINGVFERNNVVVNSTLFQGDDVVIRSAAIDEKMEETLREEVETTSDTEINVKRFETVGPSLGQETIQKTAIASLVAVIGILLYISFTFKKLSYGLAAIAAMLHDFFVLVGMYSLLGKFGAEVDALFITAVLTTMSFSVHDTIVVFDKIREYRRTSGLSIDILANKALTETMIRSVNNSLTIVLMLVPLTLMGGETIQFFAAALLIGTITGTYSSPFFATPLLVLFSKFKK